MISSAYFRFRVWFHAHGDPADVEVFYEGFEPQLEPKERSVTEWIKESFGNMDFCELFGLDETKAYQIVGEAKLSGEYNYLGDYDEAVTPISFEKQELKDGGLL